MKEIEILYVNIAIYTIFFLYFYKRYGLKNLSTVASFVYLVSSIASWLYFATPVFFFSFSNLKGLKWEGMLWLASFNFLLCNLLRGFGIEKDQEIIGYNAKFFKRLQFFLIIGGGFSVIVQLPSAINNLMSENLSDIRDLTYTDGAQVTSNPIDNLYNRIFGGLNIFLLLLPAFKFFVLKTYEKIDIWSLVVYILAFICTMGAYVSRAIIVFRLMDCIVLYFLLYKYIEFKRLKYIVVLLIPACFILSSFFSAVTSSRFGTTSSNTAAESAANLRYVGEPQLNFMAIMYNETKGCSYGYRSLPLFRKIAGLDYYGMHGKDKNSNLVPLDKVHPYPNYIFYTAGGDFYLDWGMYIPVFILIFINIFYYRLKSKMPGNFQLFVWEQLAAFFVMYGVFYANYQNESSDFLLLFLIVIWFAFGQMKYQNHQKYRIFRK